MCHTDFVKTVARSSLVVLILSVACGSSAGAVSRLVGLANPLLTPGATNSRVTPSTVRSTICVTGYSLSVRPPESYTERLKFHQLDSGYNLRGDREASHYEEDHLIPLEVGGSPTSVKNLWPEPRLTFWSASKKDELENVLHDLVCDGSLPLRAAQRVFTTNWINGFRRYVGA